MQIRKFPALLWVFFLLPASTFSAPCNNINGCLDGGLIDAIIDSSDTWPAAYVKFLEFFEKITLRYIPLISSSKYFYQSPLSFDPLKLNNFLRKVPFIYENVEFKQDLIVEYLSYQVMHKFLLKKSLVRRDPFIATLVDKNLDQLDWKFISLISLELHELQSQIDNRIMTFPEIQLYLAKYFYLEKKLYLFDEKIPKLWDLDGSSFRVAAPNFPFMIILNSLIVRLKQIEESLESIYIYLPFHFEWLLIERGQFVVVTPTPLTFEIGKDEKTVLSLFPWSFFWNRSLLVNPKSYFAKQSGWLHLDNYRVCKSGLSLILYKILPIVEAIDLLCLDDLAHQDFYPFVVSMIYLLLAFESFIEGKVFNQSAKKTKKYILSIYTALGRVCLVHTRFLQKAFHQAQVLSDTSRMVREVDCGIALVQFHLVKSIKTMANLVSIHEELLKGGKKLLHLSISDKVTNVNPIANYITKFIIQEGAKSVDLTQAVVAHIQKFN